MPKAEDKANVTAVVPVELKEKLRKYASARKWSLSTAMVTLIEEGLEREGIAPGSEDEPTQAQVEPTSLKELIRQRYFELMNSGKLGHQRLKELSFGQAPSAKERGIIKQVLGLESLPEEV